MQKTYLVGDVHGCIEELRELVQLLQPSSQDRLIFIGDLIDRGPDSAAVVKQVVRWSKEMEVKLVLGNHEEKFLRYLRHVDGGKGTEKEMKGIEEFPALHLSLSDAELEFLHEAYYSLHLPELNALLVHGGLWGKLPFPMPTSYAFRGRECPEPRQLPLLTKVRFLNPAGKFVTLGEEGDEDKYWAETYDGSFGQVYFGHQPFLEPQPKPFEFATGIDTGCVYGGWLTAVVWSGGAPDFCSVAAKKKYVTK